MFVVPALKVQQFSQEFYLLNLAAADIERLVRFEVLGASTMHGRASKSSLVNWADIEARVEASDEAYQRPILRKKIHEMSGYILQCKEDGNLPAVPGAVLLTTDADVQFDTEGGNPFVGLLRIESEHEALRVLDGQHRLLSLAALLTSSDISEADRAAASTVQVPAVLFVGLSPQAVVEMFVTINSKHTRLNASLLLSLSGKQLFSNPMDQLVHDVVRKLNRSKHSPLAGQIKMLGVGPGKVAQAGLAQEIRRVFQTLRKEMPQAGIEFEEHAPKLYLIYFREISRVLEEAWDSKQHSAVSILAVRAFVQASVPVIRAVYKRGGDPRITVAAMVRPWRERIGSARFETAGAWRTHAAGGGQETTRRLARELIAALGSPDDPPLPIETRSQDGSGGTR